jgi:hypothetical protein
VLRTRLIVQVALVSSSSGRGAYRSTPRGEL